MDSGIPSSLRPTHINTFHPFGTLLLLPLLDAEVGTLYWMPGLLAPLLASGLLHVSCTHEVLGRCVPRGGRCLWGCSFGVLGDAAVGLKFDIGKPCLPPIEVPRHGDTCPVCAPLLFVLGGLQVGRNQRNPRGCGSTPPPGGSSIVKEDSARRCSDTLWREKLRSERVKTRIWDLRGVLDRPSGSTWIEFWGRTLQTRTGGHFG